jgi:perosamine synthetase
MKSISRSLSRRAASRPSPSPIPVCEPFFAGKEESYLLDAFRSGWISSQGQYIDRFEHAFASYIGVRHAIATTSGTTALHLAVAAARLCPGDEVIVPDFTMIASAFAVAYAGAVPVFVDADPETWTLNPVHIERALTPRTRAIMVVHIYGHPADMNAIREIARRHKLTVIEDAAEAHGAEYRGQLCGRLSDIAAFSFYANKIITTGEGGMVVTDDDDLAQRCRSLKNLCFPIGGPRRYEHAEIGFNYRMSNLLAAIGLAQLEKVSEYLERRRSHARKYNARLKEVGGLQLPAEKSWAKNCYWMYGVVLDPERHLPRDQVMDRLRKAGVETRPFFSPMHDQPAFGRRPAVKEGPFPESNRLARHGFYLPSGSGLTDRQINRVCDELIRCLS